jgi:uncharacterized protein
MQAPLTIGAAAEYHQGMTKFMHALLGFTLLLPPVALAQEHPAVTAQPNTVYVGADGKFEAPPDTAEIQFSISVQDDTSQAAFQHASKEVDQVRQVFRVNEIDPKAATFGFLSVQPVYDYRNPKQKLIAYRVTSDVRLKLKDFSKVGPITQQLSDANVSESLNLTYTLENMDEAKNRAVEDAYRRARNSAETLARASGRTLGELSYASIDTFENMRIPVMHRALAMAATGNAPPPTEEFTPQAVTVTAHLNALFNLK